MIKIKFFNLLIIFLAIISCTNKTANKKEEQYYSNGKLKSIIIYNKKSFFFIKKEYFETGELKQTTKFKENFKGSQSYFYNQSGNLIATRYWIDSLNTIQNEYFKNKKIKSIGPLYNNKKNGWFKIYDEKGHLIRKDEILTINGKEILNQSKKYDLQGRLIQSESDVFSIQLKDTLKIGRSIGLIKYVPKLSNNSKYSICIGYDINRDFSNLNTVKLDTFYSKEKNDIWFGLEFKTVGKKHIKGILEEIDYKTNKEKTDLIIKKRFKYFSKEVWIIK